MSRYQSLSHLETRVADPDAQSEAHSEVPCVVLLVVFQKLRQRRSHQMAAFRRLQYGSTDQDLEESYSILDAQFWRAGLRYFVPYLL